MTHGVCIIGASHAGVQVAASLRDLGYDAPIHLIHGEATLPYQRPPLSKAYLADSVNADGLALRSPDYYASRGIELLSATHVHCIDADTRRLDLRAAPGAQAGTSLPDSLTYDHLVIATGARARQLPVPGGDLDGVLTLRTIEDAEQMKARLETARDVVIAGAGFIGLEVAATAGKLGKSVTVVEAQDRVLARLFPTMMSDFLTNRHKENGTAFLFGTQISGIRQQTDGRKIVDFSNGDSREADLVVVGIGAEVNDGLARLIGLDCDNGILVNREALTSCPEISAAGDCAAWQLPHEQNTSRTESVQNAVDQAKIIAARLTGNDIPEQVAPWFWSDQLDVKLQMVGTALDADDIVCRGEMESGRFSLLYYQGEELVRVDSVNRAIDHIAARRLVTQRIKLPKDAARDVNIKLKDFG
ncbi:NAD(P)/FAD-dependent oxidoreductase [Sneathiella chinensis]|uniref:Pyridine nucleotide-disulphide oxidoreductase family protein n=1 Tax=Sneathiella chinensis TaxID=349750 RepID=A0ABQ5U185_9PROT|nr:FAD-dependent oxidoreductase [Sneathiella chinensis]GLQ05914.1 pyridine nucleotide-disulphide oxidoreductase family protein [Sneathiella chinensis]